MRMRKTPQARNTGRRAGWTPARVLRLFEARRAELNPLDGSDRPDDAFERGWRGVIRTRVLIALAVIACWGVSLQGRLVYLQVVRHDEFVAKALKQQQDLVTPEALRGSIHDRN